MPYERAAGGYMAARKASKKVINFFVVGLTYGCRSECSGHNVDYRHCIIGNHCDRVEGDNGNICLKQ